MTAPLLSFAGSLASHTIRLATFAGWTHFEKSDPGMAARFAVVSMVPGRITFAVTPASRFSAATVLARETIAAFEALYAPTPAPGSTAARLPIAMIRPRPLLLSAGMLARKL